MFNEATVVEAFILERMTNAGWTYTFGPLLVRQTTDVIVEPPSGKRVSKFPVVSATMSSTNAVEFTLL
jgi:hypothetical protein